MKIDIDVLSLRCSPANFFAHKRLNGEWFALDNLDVEFIKAFRPSFEAAA